MRAECSASSHKHRSLCKQVPLLALNTHPFRNKHTETLTNALFTHIKRSWSCCKSPYVWTPFARPKCCQHMSSLESCCVKVFQTSCQISADALNDSMNSYHLGHNSRITWTHCNHSHDVLQSHQWATTSASAPIVVGRMGLIRQVAPMCLARLELWPDTDAVIMTLLGKAFTNLKVFSLIKMDDETVLLCC